VSFTSLDSGPHCLTLSIEFLRLPTVNVISDAWRWSFRLPEALSIPRPPVQGVRLPGTVTRKIEVKASDYWLVHACGDQLVKDVMELTARLGTRPQEVFSLTWAHVDMEASPAVVRVWMNKTSGFKNIQADADLLALLQRLRAGIDKPTGPVVKDEDGKALSPAGTFRYRFEAARKAAIEKAAAANADHQDFQLRDLRPMAGLSMMDAQGMDAARRLLGHSTEKMTAAYTTKRRGYVSQSAGIVRSGSNKAST